MKLICPHCSAEFLVVDAPIPPHGFHVDCLQCGGRLEVGPGGSVTPSIAFSSTASLVASGDGALRIEVTGAAPLIDEIDDLVETSFDMPAFSPLPDTPPPGGFHGIADELDPLTDFPVFGDTLGEISTDPNQQSTSGVDDFDFSFTDMPPGFEDPPDPQGDLGSVGGGFNAGPELADAPEVDVDDFDFSFSDLGPPPTGRIGGPDVLPPSPGDSLPGFVDDLLDDLPAPVSGLRRGEVSDLPQRKDMTDLLAPKIEDLPRSKRSVDPLADDLDLELPAPKFDIGLSEPELPAPKVGPELPVPKVGTELPVPKVGTDLPVPKVGIDVPVPKVGTEVPVPKVGIEVPVPKVGAEVPVPRVYDQHTAPKVSPEVPGETRGGYAGDSGVGGGGLFSMDDLDLPAPKGHVEVEPQAPGFLDPFDYEPDLGPQPSGAEPLSFPDTPVDMAPLSPAPLAPSLESIPELAPDFFDEEISAQPSQREAEQKGFRLIAMVAGAVVVVAAALYLGAGMLGDNDAPVDARNDKQHRAAVKDRSEDGGPPPPAVEIRASLLEILGYRDRITRDELNGTPKPGDKIRLIELYGFGAIEFTGTGKWAETSAKLAAKLDKETAASASGRRAIITARMANGQPHVLKQARRLVIEAPDDARAQYLLGHAYRKRGAKNAAFNSFKRATELEPELLPAWLYMGEAALDAHRIDEAAAAFEHLQKQEPDVPTVLNGLAQVAHRRGDLGAAKSFVETVLAATDDRLTSAQRSNALLVRARVLRDEGHEEAARSRLNEAVEVWPQNVDVVRMLAGIDVSNQKYEDALDRFEELRIKGGVDAPWMAVEVARIHVALNRNDRALDELEKAMQKFPDAPSLHVEFGRIHLRMQPPRGKDALESFKAALEIDPAYHEAHAEIAFIYRGRGQTAEAIEYLRGTIAQQPGSARLHYGLGLLQKELALTNADEGLLAAAETEFRTAIRHDPSLTGAHLELARVLLQTRRADKALGILEELRSRHDAMINVDKERGLALQTLGRHAEALEAFEVALKDAASDAELMLLSCVSHFEMRDFEKAKKHCEEARAANPNELHALFYQGRIDYSQGSLQDAIQKFEKCHAERKENIQYLYWLGRALEVGGASQRQAQDAYHQCAEAAIANPKAGREVCDCFYRRGQYLLLLNRWTKAQGDLRRALKCFPDNAEIWIKLGEAYYTAVPRQSDKAVESFEKAIEIDPSLAVAYFKIGEVRLEADRFRDAVPFFEKAVKFDPNNHEAWHRLCNLHRDQNELGRAKRACKRAIDVMPNTPEFAGLLEDAENNLRAVGGR